MYVHICIHIYMYTYISSIIYNGNINNDPNHLQLALLYSIYIGSPVCHRLAM